MKETEPEDTWYLVNAVLKHKDVLMQGNHAIVRAELIKRQQESPEEASNIYMTQHMPVQERNNGFSPLEF